MYALTRTPLGRMCNAVRDNPERAEFVGYDTQRGALHRLLRSPASSPASPAARGDQLRDRQLRSYVGRGASGVVLLAAFIGGVGYFFGPIIGADARHLSAVMLLAT